jgi:NADH dehydrogenase
MAVKPLQRAEPPALIDRGPAYPGGVSTKAVVIATERSGCSREKSEVLEFFHASSDHRWRRNRWHRHGNAFGAAAQRHWPGGLRGTGRADVILIDHNFAHAWKPMLHTFAAGTANYTVQSISFAPHAKRNGFVYMPGDFCGLDRGRKTVDLAPITLPDGHSKSSGRSISYDTLVLAIGSHANDFHTPGACEHCYFIDDVGQALAFNRNLWSQIIQTIEKNTEARVAIVGGGATGVELAAELKRGMQIFATYVPGRISPRLRIVLIESAPRLLPGFSERISDAVESTLKRLGVEVRTSTKVVEADEHGVSLEGGERIDAALRVWAAGVKAPPVAAKLDGLEVNGRGQLPVRSTLQTAQDDRIFALGDCSSCPGPDGKPLPATAQVARQQAIFLARSLSGQLSQDKPLREFFFRDMGSLIALGDYAAYGSLGHHGFLRGAFIRGWMAKLVHTSIYRMHQFDMNGILKGGAGWLADDLRRVAAPTIVLD